MMLIHDNLSKIDKKLANKLCLIYGKNKFTYQEFSDRVDFIAYRLATQVKKGDRVLIKLADPIAQLMYFFGIIKAGGSCIFVDAATDTEVCVEIIKLYKVQVDINDDFQLPESTVARLPEIQPADIFLGAFSSGSTGTPKLIWRDHTSWTSAFPEQSKVFNICGSDTLFLAGTLIYTANLNACLHMLSLGGTVVIAATRRPRTWVQEITACQANAIFMVPANYRMLLKAVCNPMEWVKSSVSGGAKLDVKTVRQLMDCFPNARVAQYYGASELGHISYITGEEMLEQPESVGKPFPGVSVRIVDDLIWAASPYLAPAYRPLATAGDLGRLDDNGYLYVMGRKQGIINSGGIKVIPEQVEAILAQCPGIAQAVVGGIADELRGQRVCAWIVKAEPSLTAADVLEFCRKRLRRNYSPQLVIFIEKIPLKTNGKVDRLQLQQQINSITNY